MTAPCRLLPCRGAASFWDWTAPLRSRCPPQAHASPPPTCALTATLHSTPAAAGPQGPSGEQFPSVSVSSDPSPTRTLALPDKADFPPRRTLPLLRPHALWWGHC